MYTLPELQRLAKEHHIKGVSLYNKSKLFDILVEKGIVDRDEGYRKIPNDRITRKPVELTHIHTGEVYYYPSIHQCVKQWKISISYLHRYNQQTYKNYKINILSS